MLNRAADAAGDVELGGDPRSSLANLVGMRPPTQAGHGARTANRPAQIARELFERHESRGASDAAATANDNPRLRKRHFSGIRLDFGSESNPEIFLRQNRLPRPC